MTASLSLPPRPGVRAEVKEALERAGRGVTIWRRIELTVFGENLCKLCGLLERHRNMPEGR